MQALRPPNVPRLSNIGITWEVLLFATAMCVGSVILFGLAPALGLGRAGPAIVAPR